MEKLPVVTESHDPEESTSSEPGNDSDEPESESHDGDTTLSADDLMGNLTGCKKAKTIAAYVLIGAVMIIAAMVFWVVDSRRREN
jgi:hypothetical protein